MSSYNGFYFALLNSAIPTPTITETSTITTITFTISSSLVIDGWQYRISPSTTWISVPSRGLGSSHTITDLSADTLYNIEIRTYIGTSYSPITTRSVRTVVDIPGFIRNLRASVGTNAIQWLFDAPASGGTPASYEYRLIRVGDYWFRDLPAANYEGLITGENPGQSRKAWLGLPGVNVPTFIISHNSDNSGLRNATSVILNTYAGEFGSGTMLGVGGGTASWSIRLTSGEIEVNANNTSYLVDVSNLTQGGINNQLRFNEVNRPSNVGNRPLRTIWDALSGTSRGQAANIIFRSYYKATPIVFTGSWTEFTGTTITTTGLSRYSTYAIEIRAKNVSGVSTGVSAQSSIN